MPAKYHHTDDDLNNNNGYYYYYYCYYYVHNSLCWHHKSLTNKHTFATDTGTTTAVNIAQ